MIEARCDVTVDDDVIRVTSRALVEESTGSCTDDCGALEATCMEDSLAPGEYLVVHGDSSERVTWPVDQKTLFDGPGRGCVF